MDFFLARSSAVGASVLVWAALAGHEDKRDDDFVDRLRGAYVSEWSVKEPSDVVLSEKGAVSQQRIWVSCYWQSMTEIVSSHTTSRMRQSKS
jgi:hypothetical protein